MKRIKSYYIIILSVSMLSFSMAQDSSIPDVVTKVATCAANWLKLETGTRAIGMGGAQVAAGRGVSGIPYNPASITFTDNQEGFMSQTNYVADISYNVLGYSRNLSGVDFVGLHVFTLDSGPMAVTNEFYPDGTGENFNFTAFCIRGTYARRLTDRLRIGATGKFIMEQIYTTQMQTFAFDIGSNFDTGIYGIVLGMSVSNLGPEVKFEGEGLEVTVPDTIDVNGTLSKITEPFSLPMTFRLGVMKDISLGSEDSDHSLIVTMDMINPIDYTLYGTFGMEYSWKDIAYVRVGQRFGHDTAKWSLGGGFRLGADGFKVGLDYAYVNYDVLDFTHQFGIKFEF